MPNEKWRVVPSAPFILASSEGRIMVAPHFTETSGGNFRHFGGSPRFGAWAKDQRRFLCRLRGKTYKVHRLVCEAFHGPSPFEGAVVMHLDEDSKNNRPENLRWGTQRENLNADGFLQYCRSRTGENHPRAKAMAAE